MSSERVPAPERTKTTDRVQIGDVAEQTGLSLRTIRYYEEAGLVAPSQRTTGGFRLYTDADIERLELITQMKPLGFSLDEMRAVLVALDTLKRPAGDAELDAARAEVRRFAEAADTRCERLRAQLHHAASLSTALRRRSAASREAVRD